MGKITLSTKKNHSITMIPNAFIDHYMVAASGSYVKIYLYLVRCLTDPFRDMSISRIADHLDETEKDITRALHYWEKASVITLSKNELNQIVDITFLPLEAETEEPEMQNQYPVTVAAKSLGVSARDSELTSIPSAVKQHTEKRITAKPSYSSVQVEQLTGISEVSNLMHSLEQLFGRTLKATDVQLVLYLYESLEFSSELILYLYEYCTAKDKKNSSYIESVALAWAEEGIHTVMDARKSSYVYQNIVACVNKAFGLHRNPGHVEQQYIERWSKQFGFSQEIIMESCNRTLLAAGKPDFKYADKILENWHEHGITDLNGVADMDREHTRMNSFSRDTKKSSAPKLSANNKFNVFPQRKYTDDEYSTMEQRLLNRN